MEYRETALAMFLNILYHLWIFTLCLCPCSCRIGIEVMAVATVDIGDIPDGIGTRTVLKRSTRHGIGELLDALGAVGKSIPCRSCPVVGSLVPYSRIEFGAMRCLQLILRLHIFLIDGIKKTSTIDTDCRLQPYLIVVGQRLGIKSTLVDGDLRITQGISLAISKLIAVFVSSRKPTDVYSILLDWSLKRCHGTCLRHTRDVADVAVGCIRHTIGIGSCRRVIDNKQIAVASVGCVITIHTLTMTVARVTSDTTVTHPCRTESLAWCLIQGKHMLKEVLTLVEVGFHSWCVSNCRCRIGITWLLCRSQLTSGIPFLC